MSEFLMDGIGDHILTADLWQSLRFRGTGLIEINVRMLGIQNAFCHCKML